MVEGVKLVNKDETGLVKEMGPVEIDGKGNGSA